jgi:pimeloyl-ACP methyl ester carboxylesterase
VTGKGESIVRFLRSFTGIQRTVLGAMAVTTVIIVIVLASIVASQSLQGMEEPDSLQPSVVTTLSQPATPTLAPTPVPTWTPRPSLPTVPPPPYFQAAPCPFEVPAGAGVDCGYLTVAEDRGMGVTQSALTESTRLIRLAVAIYRSHNGQPSVDPLLYLHGGPGGSALSSSPHYYTAFIAPLLVERDVIMFDQRGSGLSKPSLDCPEYRKMIQRELREGYAIGDVPDDRYINALMVCRDRLRRLGVNLAAYTSAGNAADVMDLVATLGYDQVNLYGVSYGTRLALTVMRDYPQIVRSVVLDSALPVEISLYAEQAYKADYAFNKLFDGCAADPVCREAYPNLEAIYYEVVERLNAEPVEVWGLTLRDGRTFNATVGGVDFTSLLFFALYSSELVELAPAMIYAVWEGDTRLLTAFMGSPLAAEASISTGVFVSVNCHEEIFTTTPEEIEAAHATYPEMQDFARAAFFQDVVTHFEFCRTWGAAPFDPIDLEPVVSELPALILAGEYDPATPPDFGRQVAANLTAGHFYEFPGQTHGVGMSEDVCALPMVRAFLDEPGVAPDADCIADMVPPSFVP